MKILKVGKEVIAQWITCGCRMLIKKEGVAEEWQKVCVVPICEGLKEERNDDYKNFGGTYLLRNLEESRQEGHAGHPNS